MAPRQPGREAMETAAAIKPGRTAADTAVMAAAPAQVGKRRRCAGARAGKTVIQMRISRAPRPTPTAAGGKRTEPSNRGRQYRAALSDHSGSRLLNQHAAATVRAPCRTERPAKSATESQPGPTMLKSMLSGRRGSSTAPSQSSRMTPKTGPPSRPAGSQRWSEKSEQQ